VRSVQYRPEPEEFVVIAERSDLVAQFVAAREHLLGFVLALTRSREVADEVIQELCVEVVREARRGTAPEKPFAWMLGMARHRVADYYRARGRDQRNVQQFWELADAMEEAFIENAPSLNETPDDDLRLRHLRECIAQLSDKMRSMLDARYGQSKPIEVIAAKMQWTAASVKVALAKARKALGECVRQKLIAAGGQSDE
jgi:RNA polymerase sigma-70 factor (ECF subfamily)